ncbi:FAD:protein FMN transferase [Thiomicrorhabdus arctica]|uniref:FAD:protein FMN transferase n=1 Tax=Thiomicrorhabdus arctica TaxID=131540 RepID=UPI0012FDE1F9|nr:FAD:protein FMN transferase [Thiomicrorhabdus arctica]
MSENKYKHLQIQQPHQRLSWTLGLALLLLLTSCSSQNSPPTKATIVVFGTLVDITLYHPDVKQAEAAIQQVETEFFHFHKEWHAWEKGGIIGKINQAIAQSQPINVPLSVKNFIIKSQSLTRASQKLFDPGIGKLIALWGFHKETWSGPPPSEKSIQHWLDQRPSLLDIYFEGLTLYSKNNQVQLDFGGNAKGLAIDMALDIIAKAGIKSAIVNIGGDMKTLGLKNGQPWSVGIQNPNNPSNVEVAIHLNADESIVTSGTYQRYFEWHGQRYSHIINPNTGYPAQGFASVTVLHNDATTADAAATAILIAGPKNWLNIAKSMGLTYVLCIDNQGKILQTKAMAERTKLL